jgi:hypothetical protein
MRMRTIFLLLNAVLVVAFAVIFLTPLFLLGTDWFNLFWSRNWPIAIVFVVTLGAVDAYFLLNWKLFGALEKEDWAGVASFLEQRIFTRGMALRSYVRLLLNTYLVTSNTDGILALEAYCAKKKPGLIPYFGLTFGIPHLLAKDPADPEQYYRKLLDSPRTPNRDWLCWNHAFSLLQLKRSDDARKTLVDLADRVKDPVLLLLSLYLLDVVMASDPDLEARIKARRDELVSKHTPATLQAAVERSGGNMQVVVLARLLQDAIEWIFSKPGAAPAGAVAATGEKTPPQIH